ncbi:ketoacyl-ACP synthase III family protein [Amycolatopsis sp. H20-H5]|uniref:ketoacyl-ACP synthase III family protein n=1 Tax=Amycolatopsis sp. H20-H5 TaxID=3046309 RepID=UPI002DBA3BC0|nr:ketoacyl-ACP synthase III family protein [Amycolatopsis sp. H20-H5]MEC3977385.1 ketoacyl-ACP synthase III family protein [Amycolatopsis sp. H20-H5]
MRTVDPVGITSATLWLPHQVETAESAVLEGRLRGRQAEDLGHRSVPVAGVDAPPDMAVCAARSALKEAELDAAELSVVAHAWMYYQGHDLWSPAHYIARELGALDAFPVGVQQVCNGGAAALELIAARLSAPAGTGSTRWGLVSTADRFAEPGFDRWASDYGVAYGDAGTAVVLSAPAGPGDALLLRSIATVAAPGLEAMHRGADPFGAAARTHRERVDMRATKRAYLHEHGSEQFRNINEHSIRTVVANALRDACLAQDDPCLRYAFLPRFGRKTLAESWIPVLGAQLTAELVDLGRTTGHLGAGDAAAGLADLIRTRVLEPGEAALVFSAGAGFTWSCLVVQAPRHGTNPSHRS